MLILIVEADWIECFMYHRKVKKMGDLAYLTTLLIFCYQAVDGCGQPS
jgi:hypothetical protein